LAQNGSKHLKEKVIYITTLLDGYWNALLIFVFDMLIQIIVDLKVVFSRGANTDYLAMREYLALMTPEVVIW